MHESRTDERVPLRRRDFLVLTGSAAVAGSARADSTNRSGNDQPAAQASGAVTNSAKSKIRIAQIKVVPERGKLEANHRTLMELLGEIEQEGTVDVVVSPECFLDGLLTPPAAAAAEQPSLTPSDIGQYAVDPKTSPYVKAVAQWCQRNGTWFIYGCSRKGGTRVYNSALLIDRRGSLVDWFDKLHVGPTYAPGARLPVYDSDFGRFGVMICADRRWPETVRTLALKGARVIFNPSYGSHSNFNRMMLRTRSYESEVFIVFTHPRQALITHPKSEVVHNCEGESFRYSIASIDLADVDRHRARSCSHLTNRRPDVYAL